MVRENGAGEWCGRKVGSYAGSCHQGPTMSDSASPRLILSGLHLSRYLIPLLSLTGIASAGMSGISVAQEEGDHALTKLQERIPPSPLSTTTGPPPRGQRKCSSQSFSVILTGRFSLMMG
jgi:hypothetical protein